MHPRGELGRELGVKRRRSALGEIALDRGPDLRRHRRAQLEVGERGAQVEAGPADDDRAAPGRQQAVDLGVRELGEAPGANSSSIGDEADQPVLESRLLGSALAAPLRVSSPA